MGKKYWAAWFPAALIRALKTFAQAAVALLPVSARIDAISWVDVVATAALAAVVSLLTSLAGLPEVPVEQKEQDNKKEE